MNAKSKPQLFLDELSRQDLVVIVNDIREILWPNEDPDNEFDVYTPFDIANVLVSYGLCPEEKIPE